MGAFSWSFWLCRRRGPSPGLIAGGAPRSSGQSQESLRRIVSNPCRADVILGVSMTIGERDVRSAARASRQSATHASRLPSGGESRILDRSIERDGSELVLVQRDGSYQIRVDGRELMDSRHALTECEMARLAWRYSARSDRPEVLVGGLGMGFTLRACLDLLPADGRLTVVELSAAVLRWNQGPLAALAGRPLCDPRVMALHCDVLDVLRRSDERFEAVLLDVDNGPHDLAQSGNGHLYEPDGLSAACRALRPGGVLAVWSSEPAPDLVERLLQIGVPAWSESVFPLVGDSRVRHTIVLAARPDA